MAREKFSSKRKFIISCVGAAVGLGNALRFPGLCAKYGGGAYLLVYFVALAVLGVPLLNAEIALGRKFGGGAPRCMGSLKRHASGAGWICCTNSLFTAIIYAGLAGWLLAAAFTVFPLARSAPQMSQPEVGAYFFGSVLKSRSDGVISGISWGVLACIAAAWAFMFLCLRGGANALSKTAEFAVAVPVILLLFMAGRGLAYPNSLTALKALFVPDFSKLASPQLWISALGQVFFSLSLAIGVMPAFGEYLPDGVNIFGCSLYIAAADFGVSVLASAVMFTTLYGCGLEGMICDSGIITAFSVYPSAICGLFGGATVANGIVGIVFYLSLALMAMQSAVSMAEAFISPVATAFGVKKRNIVAAVCAAGAALSVFFATTAAPLAVEISDKFVNFYNVILLAVAECVIIATSGKLPALAAEINRFSGRLKLSGRAARISVKYLSPAVLGLLAAMEILRLIMHGLNYPAWAQIAFGWGLSAAIVLLAYMIERLTRPHTVRLGRKPQKITQNLL